MTSSGRSAVTLSRLATKFLLLAAAFQQLAPASGFLFPDLKFRTGGAAGGPKYRIAVIQEEPYMSANGSGYLPELVRELSTALRTLHPGEAELQFDVVPVHSWQQLMSRARTTKYQLALGLVIPSLDLTGWVGRQLPTSAPVVYTTLKMVVRRQRRASAAAAAAAASSGDWNDVVSEESNGLEAAAAGQQPRRHVSVNDRAKVIVLRGSPVEYLLIRGNHYRGPVQQADSMGQAVQALLSSGDDVALLTDAVVADHLANTHAGELESVCPSRLGGSGWLSYAFFGRDAAMVQKLTSAVASMTNDESLLGLYSKRLGAQTQHCTY